jgi:hypothetical protein
MKRRDFLKTVAAATGGMFYRSNALQSAKMAPGAPSVVAIRGLAQENGKLWQPIQIFLPTVTGG